MFHHTADIYVNTVNCVGVMGAGLALAFKNKYPAMFRDYRKACLEHKVSPTSPHLYQLQDGTTILNLPTKDHFRNPSRFYFVQQSIIWLRKYLIEHPDVTIAVPPLGCGLGGLNWDSVRSEIYKQLGDLDATVLLFAPK